MANALSEPRLGAVEGWIFEVWPDLPQEALQAVGFLMFSC